MLSICHYMLRGVVIVVALRLFVPPPTSPPPPPTRPRPSASHLIFHSRSDSCWGAPFPTKAASPLGLTEFSRELNDYPNPQKQFVLDGIRDGFHVGFEPATVTLRSRSRNLTSALDHPGVIDQYLAKEVSLLRVAGPFPSPPLPNLQVSPFGVIPKRNQPGEWRLILDLSSPHGSSSSMMASRKNPIPCTTLLSTMPSGNSFHSAQEHLWPNSTSRLPTGTSPSTRPTTFSSGCAGEISFMSTWSSPLDCAPPPTCLTPSRRRFTGFWRPITKHPPCCITSTTF